MSSINSITGLLSPKYASNGMDLKDALSVWKELNLSPDDIRENVFCDIKERISSVDAKILYKLARFMNDHNPDVIEDDRYGVFNKLKSAKSVKLTPMLITAMEKVGDNTYRIKNASIDISWSIEMRDGVPWLKRMSNPQSIVKNDENASVKESRSVGRIKQADDSQYSRMPWEKYFFESGIAEKMMVNYPGTLPDSLIGIVDAVNSAATGQMTEVELLFKIKSIIDDNQKAIDSLKKLEDEKNEKIKKLREDYESGKDITV